MFLKNLIDADSIRISDSQETPKLLNHVNVVRGHKVWMCLDNFQQLSFSPAKVVWD